MLGNYSRKCHQSDDMKILPYTTSWGVNVYNGTVVLTYRAIIVKKKLHQITTVTLRGSKIHITHACFIAKKYAYSGESIGILDSSIQAFFFTLY